jgi:hypothetical protein
MIFIFVSMDPSFIQEVKTFFQRTTFIEVLEARVEELSVHHSAFICPCDSFCSMNYGIGKIYNEKVFPYIETNVRKKLASLETKTLYGRHYLPVGSAMLVCGDQKEEGYIVFSPVGFRPFQNITETRNVYHSFMASLCLLKRYHNENITKLIFPEIDKEFRGVTARRFAEQIYAALIDFTFLLHIPKAYYNLHDFTVFITYEKERNKEQPDYYENMEIKHYKEILNLIAADANQMGNMIASGL